MTLTELNSLNQADFVAMLGGIFEHSPWVAERVFSQRPFASLDALCAAMTSAVDAATEAEKLTLLREHPDLGTRARVSASSAAEQAGAGLTQLTQSEFDELTALNTSYKAKFGFPFLYAVKGSGKAEILEALRARSGNGVEEEFAEALRQVYRIAHFRLQDLIRL